jgi:CDP-diacylglycerol--inositol 3-phosphatidyltransferase
MREYSANITKKPHVLVYVPNLICYVRLVLLILVPFFALRMPILALSICTISAILDAFDGYFARRLAQESYLGTVLDYIIDRATLTLMQVILIMLFPQFWCFFMAVLVLDIVSHISHVYASLFLKRTHHKQIQDTQSKLLTLYYSNRVMLFLTCFLHDIWFGFVYLYYFYPNQSWIMVGCFTFLPFFFLKTLVHILQLWDSLYPLIKLDELKAKE